ncbi:MAG: putative toxin-antitoxin system toxin component, PIN family [Bryobacteraceae bacterium]|jgi:putative PIN family toxin of toxin-antitoxin system
MNTGSRARLRVVLDTNVLIAAFTNPLAGIPFQIWRNAVDRRYTLLISPAIVDEFAAVLRRKFSWDDFEILPQVKLLARVAEIITPKIVLTMIAEDDADNRILECAVAGQADLIVSGDNHLRRLKAFRGMGIIRPVDFHRTLGL